MEILLKRRPKNVWHFDAAHAGYPVRGFCATARSFRRCQLPISAMRALTGTVGFMSGGAGEIRPTPLPLLGSVFVEGTTGVFAAT